MGLNETVFGSPGQTQVHQTAGSKPPGFNFARDFFNSLGGIAQNPYPTYQGQLDPGLSPSMQNILRQAQGYAQSGPPEILAGVQGSLGRFMNPNFTNPAARFGQGVPDYFNQNPNQTVFNGGTPGGLQGVFGAQGPAGMGGPKAPAGPSAGTIGGDPGSAGGGGGLPPMPDGKSGGGNVATTMPYSTGGPGSDGGYQTPPYAGGYGQDAVGTRLPLPAGGGQGGGYGPGGISSPSPGGGWSPTSGLSFPGGGGFQDFTKPAAGGGLPGVFSPGGQGAGTTLTGPPVGGGPGGGWQDFSTPGPGGWGAAPGGGQGGGGGHFGGYSVDQLQQDPSLAGKLGPHAAALWRAFGGGQGGGPNTMHPLNPGMQPGMGHHPGQMGGPGGKPMRDPRTGGMAAQPPPVPGMQYGGPGTGK